MNTLLTKTNFHALPGRLIRRLRRKYNDQCVNIVTYHSVSKDGNVLTDGTGLRHHPAMLECHIDYLVEHYKPISLRDLVSALERGEVPQRAVVITLDDGYADSLHQAMPVLYRRRIPMTVFPVTSVIGNADLLWSHKLAWLVAEGHAEKVDDALTAHKYPPRDENEPLLEYARRRFRTDLPEILEDVLRSTGGSGPRLAAALRPYLEPEDIAEADPAFVDFGNHTHTHPILSALTADQQHREIVTARSTLKSLTGTAPIALAYPFGLRPHYQPVSKRIAQETGHRAALDMRCRINVGRIDPFELSRKPAPCGSQEDFEKMMEDWPANAPGNLTGGHR